jgi:hypothetical protein
MARRNKHEVLAVAKIHFLPGESSKTRKMLFYVICLLLAWGMQHLLNTKGVCTLHWQQDPIDDFGVRVTTDLNHYLVHNPDRAAEAQALSSFLLDLSMLTLFFLAAIQRSTALPFLALLVFIAFRFVAQLSATIPCAPGFIWPQGRVLGWLVPTLVVDYHPANDMFFSGHVGTLVVNGIQFFQMGCFKTAFWHAAALPFVATLVVTFRVHRGMDVIAAVLAAIAACSVAEHAVGPVDRFIMKPKPRAKAISCSCILVSRINCVLAACATTNFGPTGRKNAKLQANCRNNARKIRNFVG